MARTIPANFSKEETLAAATTAARRSSHTRHRSTTQGRMANSRPRLISQAALLPHITSAVAK